MATSKKSKTPAKPVSKKACTQAACKPAAKNTRAARPVATRTPVKATVKAATPRAVPVIVMTPNATTLKSVTFAVRADPDSQIFIAGDFNKWDAAATRLTDPTNSGVFSTVLQLRPGSYEYKFVINGTWCVDPDCAEWVQNNLGTLNSVCKV